jgi:high-affinity Fe2+/Pb2+ permease
LKGPGPRPAPVRGRALTIIAVALLALDGGLLLLAGLWGRQPGLMAFGAGLLLAALLVVLLWRRHRRTVAEIAAAREAVRAEASALRDLVRRVTP